MRKVRLGLIGDNVARSRSPDLHRACGELAGLDVTYDLMIPPQMGQSFDEVFEAARTGGYGGVNVTLPYKEKVLSRLTPATSVVADIAAVNTVRFGEHGPKGHNTDHSGFIAAYRAAFGQTPPGTVVLIGAGGVGKAVAFGLLDLGAESIVVLDNNQATAQALVLSLNRTHETQVARTGDLGDLTGASGVVNGTPLGMHGYPGSPVPQGAFPTGGWAFDAVYTPLDTPFRDQARAAGARFLSGYELFFHQGLQAFEIFTGCRVDDHAALRRMLDQRAEVARA